MKRRLILAGACVAALGGAALLLLRRLREAPSLSEAEFAARYTRPLPAPQQGMATYHLGHSLVGRTMPHMLAQLAHAAGFAAHSYASQLGWGASLAQHRDGPVPGFDAENAHDKHLPAKAAITSGRFDSIVLTEMVEIRDAIKYHDSARSLAYWTAAARAANPAVRVYLYETWHPLTDPEGWLTRADADLDRYWKGQVLRPAMADPATGTIYIIPGGQAMAAVVRAIEAGEIDGLSNREDLFARTPEGTTDPIHFNDLGAYVIALTHFATLYHRSPEGLPFALTLPDNTSAQTFSESAAGAVQRVVWRVVSAYAATGVGRNDTGDAPDLKI